MSSKIKRLSSLYADILITNDVATTTEISFTDEASMVLYFPSNWTACNVVVYAKNPVSGTYNALIDQAATAVTLTGTQAAASKAAVLPDAIFPCRYLKFVSDDAANNAKVVGADSKG